MSKSIDLIGKKFGRLSVIAESTRNTHGLKYKCECLCGETAEVYRHHLTQGRTRSCGCLASESTIKRNTIHGKTRTTEFNTWQGMRARCLNKKTPAYYRYGGRGIIICAQWVNSFETFINDMGDKPRHCRGIDRIDNNGDYEPSNCRWATYKENTRNTRASKWWYINGIKFESSLDAATTLRVSTSTIARWCNGTIRRGKFVKAKPGCYSQLKYEGNL